MKKLVKLFSIYFILNLVFIGCSATNGNLNYEQKEFDKKEALKISKDIWKPLNEFFIEIDVFDDEELNEKIKNKEEFFKYFDQERFWENCLEELYNLMFIKEDNEKLKYNGNDKFPNVYNKDVYIDRAYMTTIFPKDNQIEPYEILTIELKADSTKHSVFSRSESYRRNEKGQWAIYSMDGINGFFIN